MNKRNKKKVQFNFFIESKIRFDWTKLPLPSPLPHFYHFYYGRLLFMEAISVPVYIIPIRSRNLCNRDVRKGRERKRNLSFVEGSRIPLSRRMTYQPACPRLLFFFFSILFSTFERKIDGLITRFTFGEYRGGRGERMFPRERQPEARAPSPLDIAIQPRWPRNTRFPLFVTVSRPSRAYGFVLRPRILSICRAEKCLDRVSISKNFGWLTWQPSKERH